ncbi:hypothetical protein BDF19DRAFT_424332 [Syncephalis fuscata]|nr:hypothetical protein BDF19DRAFT_424332 [Syncephalis fuscata]
MSNYQSYNLLANLNTIPPYAATDQPVTTDTATISVDEEASLQRELDWWQSVEFGVDGLPSAPVSRKPSTTAEIAGKESILSRPQQQLQERLRQESSVAGPKSKKTKKLALSRSSSGQTSPQPPQQAASSDVASATNNTNLLRNIIGLPNQGIDATALAALLLQQQQQQQQQQQERAAQALLASQNVPFNLLASLQTFNTGLFGTLAASPALTSVVQPALLSAQLAAASNNVQPPAVSAPTATPPTISIPVPAVGSPVAPTEAVPQRTTSPKRRSPSPIRPALPAKRISLSPSPPATSPLLSKSIISPDEDKRRRNTAASARFRLKKKQKEQQLEKTAQDMTDRVQGLEDRLRELEQENRWLRSLVIEKDPMLLGEGDGKRARLVEVDAQASAGGGVSAKESL